MRRVALALSSTVLLIAAFAGIPSEGTPTASPLDEKPAAGKFLVASHHLQDPWFSQTVVLLIEHGSQGTLGLVVNRPSQQKIAAAFEEIEGVERHAETIDYGGPVAGRVLTLLVRSEKPLEDAIHVTGDLYFTSNRDVLERLLKEEPGAQAFRAFSGHSGWAPGQLDAEIARGDWFVQPAGVADVFADPTELWHKLLRRASSLVV